MRLAVIADIHGNILALEAVLADIARRGPFDLTLDLGDCLSGPLWPRETAERLLALGWPTVRGNHDRWMADWPLAEMYASDRFALDEITSAQRAWLAALPPECVFDTGRIRAFHGTPADDNAYLTDAIEGGRLVERAPAEIGRDLGVISAPLVLCAHSHRPRLVSVARGGDVTVVINPGSVGCPGYRDPHGTPHVSEAGAPHARYAIVTTAAGVVSGVDLIAVAYDWEAAACRAEDHGRPEWAFALRTGFMPAAAL